MCLNKVKSSLNLGQRRAVMANIHKRPNKIPAVIPSTPLSSKHPSCTSQLHSQDYDQKHYIHVLTSVAVLLHTDIHTPTNYLSSSYFTSPSPPLLSHPSHTSCTHTRSPLSPPHTYQVPFIPLLTRTKYTPLPLPCIPGFPLPSSLPYILYQVPPPLPLCTRSPPFPSPLHSPISPGPPFPSPLPIRTYQVPSPLPPLPSSYVPGPTFPSPLPIGTYQVPSLPLLHVVDGQEETVVHNTEALQYLPTQQYRQTNTIYTQTVCSYMQKCKFSTTCTDSLQTE